MGVRLEERDRMRFRLGQAEELRGSNIMAMGKEDIVFRDTMLGMQREEKQRSWRGDTPR